MAGFFQLAYMAAAANGQTGRTLSDKDLAFHLNIVGQDVSNDPEVQIGNLMRFVDSLISGADSQVGIRLNKRDLDKYNVGTDETSQSMLNYYYTPDNNDWNNYLTNKSDALTYNTFSDRYGHILDLDGVPFMEKWWNLENKYYDRKGKGSRGGDQTGVPPDLDGQINNIRNMLD